MRIAVVHSFYSSAQPSGENRVVTDQVEALGRAGHEVCLIARRTDERDGSPTYPLRAAWSAATGGGSDPTSELREFAPDVVHIHNLFPNFGTRWVDAWPGPVVATLHNYRSFCANGLLYRDGHACSECPDSGQAHAVVHGCYHGSRLATIPVASGLTRRGLGLLERVDRIIVTSSGSARILSSHLPATLQMDLVPNFGVGQVGVPLREQERTAWVALGRFTAEKGFVDLARMWPVGPPLVIIGDGTEAQEIRKEARGKSIEVRPSLPIEQLRAFLPTCRALLFPSLWPDVAPQVVVEAMRVGLPVIAHRANVVADLVASTGAGATYGDAAELKNALATVSDDLPAMSMRAIEVFVSDWTEAAWLARIEAVYLSVVSAS